MIYDIRMYVLVIIDPFDAELEQLRGNCLNTMASEALLYALWAISSHYIGKREQFKLRIQFHYDGVTEKKNPLCFLRYSYRYL